MEINVKHIFEGWANYVKDKFDTLDPEIKNLSATRLAHCDACHIRKGHACDPKRYGRHVETGELVRGCGCHIAAKSMVPDARCPMGKW
jgi:hypothetical protein